MSPGDRKVRVGIVGLGYWGPNLLRNFYHHPKVELVGICDLSEERIRFWKWRYPHIAKTTVDYGEVLNWDVDLVVLATPPETHFELVKMALDRNKDVFVEKPITVRLEDALQLERLAEERNRKIFVDHTFIFHPVVRKIKDLVQEGEIGEVVYFDSERINLGIFQREVNVVWDLAVHDISIFLYWLDYPRIKRSYCFSHRHFHGGQEDLAHLVLETDTGVVGHIHVSWLSPVKIRKTLLGGTNKMIWWDDVHPFEKLKVYDAQIKGGKVSQDPFFPTYVLGDVTIVRVENKEPLAIEVDSVVNSILGDKEPEVGISEGIKVLEVLESLKGGGNGI